MMGLLYVYNTKPATSYLVKLLDISKKYKRMWHCCLIDPPPDDRLALLILKYQLIKSIVNIKINPTIKSGLLIQYSIVI